MDLKVKPIACQVQILGTAKLAIDIVTWFQDQPSVGDKAWFLAHADDGIIWGRLQNNQLITSDSTFPRVSPPLRVTTLQQARIFGKNAEVRLWRDNIKFKACRLEDEPNNGSSAFDEANILWGTQLEDKANGFSLVSDGRQGLKHAVPIEIAETAFNRDGGMTRPLRLNIRHYLSYDKDGQARIALSRLAELYVRGG
jgi:CRISPR-associated protein (TIGR03984 family)